MAATKREEWEVERDREEIAALLARHRHIPHERIAKILNKRRQDEFRAAVAEATKGLEDDDLIPEIPPAYTLTRQMVDYDIKALRKEFRKRANQKFDQARALQLNEIDELAKAAWAGYERSQQVHDSLTRKTTNVKVKGVESDGLPLGVTRLVDVPAERIEESRKREQLIGDPRFLQVVDRALERREKLLGLVTEEVNVNVQPTDVKLVRGFNPEEWDKAGEELPAATPESNDSESSS